MRRRGTLSLPSCRRSSALIGLFIVLIAVLGLRRSVSVFLECLGRRSFGPMASLGLFGGGEFAIGIVVMPLHFAPTVTRGFPVGRWSSRRRRSWRAGLADGLGLLPEGIVASARFCLNFLDRSGASGGSSNPASQPSHPLAARREEPSQQLGVSSRRQSSFSPTELGGVVTRIDVGQRIVGYLNERSLPNTAVLGQRMPSARARSFDHRRIWLLFCAITECRRREPPAP